MLDVKKDRQSYGDLLRAPYGYHVAGAIGTTYALDMETMLAVVIALSDDQAIDNNETKNPVAILQAIRSMVGRVVVFCEAGQIKRPQNPSPLYLLLESMIVQVALPKKGKKNNSGFPAFHAKTWTLKYINDSGDVKYRFVVLSRNLTADRSWDISIALDSDQAKHSEVKSKPLADFLRYLGNTWAPSGRSRQLILKTAAELESVSFSTEDKRFPDETFDIIPIGIKDGKDAILHTPLMAKTRPYSADCSFQHLIVFSPFVSSDMIGFWNDSQRSLTGTRRTLITRKSELGKIKPEDADRFTLFCLKDAVVDGEDMISDEAADKSRQDIHAKMYLREKYSDVDLYLGSMNATHAAVYQNVEMMIHLHTKPRYLSAESFLRDLWGGDESDVGNPFEQVSLAETLPETNDASNAELLENCLKAVCRGGLKATALQDADGRWSLVIKCAKQFADAQVLVRPLAVKISKPLESETIFHGLSLLEVSAFWSVTIRNENAEIERVIMVPTKGLPEHREDAVIQAVIHDRRAFIEYLAFLLEDDYLLSLLEIKNRSSGSWDNLMYQQTPALYEKLLKAALTSKEKLLEIQDIARRLGDSEVIPEGFQALFQVVCDAAGIRSEGV